MVWNFSKSSGKSVHTIKFGDVGTGLQPHAGMIHVCVRGSRLLEVVSEREYESSQGVMGPETKHVTSG